MRRAEGLRRSRSADCAADCEADRAAALYGALHGAARDALPGELPGGLPGELHNVGADDALRHFSHLTIFNPWATRCGRKKVRAAHSVVRRAGVCRRRVGAPVSGWTGNRQAKVSTRPVPPVVGRALVRPTAGASAAPRAPAPACRALERACCCPAAPC